MRDPKQHRARTLIDGLLSEHRMMDTVVDAIEKEASRLKEGGALRMEFWTRAVEFIADFIHRCHQAKEEILFPALERSGALGAGSTKEVQKEHSSASNLIDALCDGIKEGDWESALRFVSMYVHRVRPHMKREEDVFEHVDLSCLTDDVVEALHREFSAVDAAMTNGESLDRFATLAERLAGDASAAEASG